MPRRPRVFVEGALYHVYNRFAGGEGVFGDPEEAIGFVERLREVKTRDGFVVFAWTLLTNHYLHGCHVHTSTLVGPSTLA